MIRNPIFLKNLISLFIWLERLWRFSEVSRFVVLEPGAMPQALLMSPRWGLPGAGLAWGDAPGFINVAPLGLAWGDAPGFINVAPLGLAR
jgi:hypothetical protein